MESLATRRLPLLALVVAAVGALSAGCGGGGGGASTEATGTAQLSEAIARYTGLPSGEADAIASSVRGTSAEALAALTQAVDAQPPLPSSASVATELETMGRDRGFEADAALADLCAALLSEPVPPPSIELDPASDALEVRWPEPGPAVQLGRAVDRAAVSILKRKFKGAGYPAMTIEKFEDALVDTARTGVPEGSDPNEVLLWLRLHQLRAGVCA